MRLTERRQYCCRGVVPLWSSKDESSPFLLLLFPSAPVVMWHDGLMASVRRPRAAKTSWHVFNTTTGRIRERKGKTVRQEDVRVRGRFSLWVPCCPLTRLEEGWSFSSSLHNWRDNICHFKSQPKTNLQIEIPWPLYCKPKGLLVKFCIFFFVKDKRGMCGQPLKQQWYSTTPKLLILKYFNVVIWGKWWKLCR